MHGSTLKLACLLCIGVTSTTTAEKIDIRPDGKMRDVGANSKGTSSRRLAPLSAAGGVMITGLNQPTSVHWDPYGNIFVLEKAGIIKRMTSWRGTPTEVILDISSQTSHFGDHGFTSIFYDSGFIYGTYMKLSYKWGGNCADYGAMDGRARAIVDGCNVYGRLSRWPVSDEDGHIIGPEEVLLDTEIGNKACSQFSTHSVPACVTKGADGYFYISLGDGAAFTTVDPGDLGQNTCNDSPPYLGAFRAQDPDRWNGKTLRLDPVTFEPEIVTTGHRNPYRLTVAFGDVYATETGWYAREEFNLIRPGRNLGWPCREGSVNTPEYHGFALCTQLEAATTFTPPTYEYEHPQVVAPMVTSISSLAGWNNRFYFGDFAAGWIKSINRQADPASEQIHMRDVYATELRVTDDNILIYLDHTKGIIGAVTVGGGPLATPSPIARPEATIIPTHPTWTPFIGMVTMGSESNIAGREGANYQWTVVLLQNCGTPGPQQTCDWTWLFQDRAGGSLNFQAPFVPANSGAALEISLEVNTGLGATQQYTPATATIIIPSLNANGGNVCTCGGVRTNISPPAPPAGRVWIAAPGDTPAGATPVYGPVNLPSPPLPGSLSGVPLGTYVTVEILNGEDGSADAVTTRNTMTMVTTPTQTTWTPGSTTEKITFVATPPSALVPPPPLVPAGGSGALLTDGTINVNYTWRVYAFTTCTRNSCGWVHLLTIPTSPYRVLVLDSPALKISASSGGITLVAEVVVTNNETGAAISGGFGYLPSDGENTTCTCAEAVVSGDIYMTTLSGSSVDEPAGTFVYAASMASVSNNVPIVPGSGGGSGGSGGSGSGNTGGGGSGSATSASVPWYDKIDTKSASFIGGIAAACAVVGVIAIAVVASVAYSRRRNTALRTANAAAAADGHVGGRSTSSSGGGDSNNNKSQAPSSSGGSRITGVPPAPLSARRGMGVAPLDVQGGGGATAARGMMSPPTIERTPQGARRV